MLHNDKYLYSYASQKNLWKGGEGNFSKDDLRPYFRIINNTTVINNANRISDMQREHRERVQVGQHLSETKQRTIDQDKDNNRLEMILNL